MPDWLEIEDLEVRYGRLPALRGISLKVESAEQVALIGANGAGKTTLLNAVSGLKDIHAGQVRWQERRIDRLSPDEIGRLGLIQVPEGRKLFARMTVMENLEIGAYAPRAREQRRQSLAQVFQLFPRLAERRRQEAGTLSGGEQQMLAVARAIMARPRMILFDEPTLGLAPLAAREIFENIGRLNRLGLGVLLVSQEVRQTLKMTSRAYVLENGRIVLQGPSLSLGEDPAVKEAYLGI